MSLCWSAHDGITIDLQTMLDAIDEKTLVVPISHVLFKSAFIQNAVAIIEKAHRVGAYVVLDAYQSVQQMSLLIRKAQELHFTVHILGSKAYERHDESRSIIALEG